MAYEATPFGPSVSDQLPVLIGGGADDAPALFLLDRPADGRVHVRVWSGEQWGAPVDREQPARELADELEAQIARAEREGRTVTQSAYAVRLWLTGGGPR